MSPDDQWGHSDPPTRGGKRRIELKKERGLTRTSCRKLFLLGGRVSKGRDLTQVAQRCLAMIQKTEKSEGSKYIYQRKGGSDRKARLSWVQRPSRIERKRGFPLITG